MFMVRIAGIDKTTDTSASVTGCPALLTVTINVTSPDFGAAGSLLNVMSRVAVVAVVPAPLAGGRS
jgi:hypothetical protein